MLTYADVCRRMLTDADGYGQSEEFEESNYDRLVRKWGGKAEFEVLNLLALLLQKYKYLRGAPHRPKKNGTPSRSAVKRCRVFFFSFVFFPLFVFHTFPDAYVSHTYPDACVSLSAAGICLLTHAHTYADARACVRILVLVIRMLTHAQRALAYVILFALASCDMTFCVSIRQHTPAYVSIRQHTSAYVSMRQHASVFVSIRQHTSAYVSIRQHTSAHVSITYLGLVDTHGLQIQTRMLTYADARCACVNIRQHTSAYVSIRPHTSAHISIT
jgi:hypothetical protein